jgi:hypothetical protein
MFHKVGKFFYRTFGVLTFSVLLIVGLLASLMAFISFKIGLKFSFLSKDNFLGKLFHSKISFSQKLVFSYLYVSSLLPKGFLRFAHGSVFRISLSYAIDKILPKFISKSSDEERKNIKETIDESLFDESLSELLADKELLEAFLDSQKAHGDLYPVYNAFSTMNFPVNKWPLMKICAQALGFSSVATEQFASKQADILENTFNLLKEKTPGNQKSILDNLKRESDALLEKSNSDNSDNNSTLIEDYLTTPYITDLSESETFYTDQVNLYKKINEKLGDNEIIILNDGNHDPDRPNHFKDSLFINGKELLQPTDPLTGDVQNPGWLTVDDLIDNQNVLYALHKEGLTFDKIDGNCFQLKNNKDNSVSIQSPFFDKKIELQKDETLKVYIKTSLRKDQIGQRSEKALQSIDNILTSLFKGSSSADEELAQELIEAGKRINDPFPALQASLPDKQKIETQEDKNQRENREKLCKEHIKNIIPHLGETLKAFTLPILAKFNMLKKPHGKSKSSLLLQPNGKMRLQKSEDPALISLQALTQGDQALEILFKNIQSLSDENFNSLSTGLAAYLEMMGIDKIFTKGEENLTAEDDLEPFNFQEHLDAILKVIRKNSEQDNSDLAKKLWVLTSPMRKPDEEINLTETLEAIETVFMQFDSYSRNKDHCSENEKKTLQRALDDYIYIALSSIDGGKNLTKKDFHNNEKLKALLPSLNKNADDNKKQFDLFIKVVKVLQGDEIHATEEEKVLLKTLRTNFLKSNAIKPHELLEGILSKQPKLRETKNNALWEFLDLFKIKIKELNTEQLASFISEDGLTDLANYLLESNPLEKNRLLISLLSHLNLPDKQDDSLLKAEDIDALLKKPENKELKDVLLAIFNEKLKKNDPKVLLGDSTLHFIKNLCSSLKGNPDNLKTILQCLLNENGQVKEDISPSSILEALNQDTIELTLKAVLELPLTSEILEHVVSPILEENHIIKDEHQGKELKGQLLETLNTLNSKDQKNLVSSLFTLFENLKGNNDFDEQIVDLMIAADSDVEESLTQTAQKHIDKQDLFASLKNIFTILQKKPETSKNLFSIISKISAVHPKLKDYTALIESTLNILQQHQEDNKENPLNKILIDNILSPMSKTGQDHEEIKKTLLSCTRKLDEIFKLLSKKEKNFHSQTKPMVEQVPKDIYGEDYLLTKKMNRLIAGVIADLVTLLGPENIANIFVTLLKDETFQNALGQSFSLSDKNLELIRTLTAHDENQLKIFIDNLLTWSIEQKTQNSKITNNIIVQILEIKTASKFSGSVSDNFQKQIEEILHSPRTKNDFNLFSENLKSLLEKNENKKTLDSIMQGVLPQILPSYIPSEAIAQNTSHIAVNLIRNMPLSLLSFNDPSNHKQDLIWLFAPNLARVGATFAANTISAFSSTVGAFTGLLRGSPVSPAQSNSSSHSTEVVSGRSHSSPHRLGRV